MRVFSVVVRCSTLKIYRWYIEPNSFLQFHPASHVHPLLVFSLTSGFVYDPYPPLLQRKKKILEVEIIPNLFLYFLLTLPVA